MVEDEINVFIREDDDLAQRLDRRSSSPTNHRKHQVGEPCI